jgi:hypothetical protein
MSFKEITLKPGDKLYHGTKKKISFNRLGGLNNIEPYGFSTNSLEYAQTYAGKAGTVLSWTPSKELRILVLSKTSLKAAITWIDEKYSKPLSNKVISRIMTKEYAMRATLKTKTDDKLKRAVKENPLTHKVAKSLIPSELFGSGSRYNKKEAKRLTGLHDKSNYHLLTGGLRRYFRCVYLSPQWRNQAETTGVTCAPISLTNTGYFRYSSIGFDVGMYHYLFKYLKHMKYDGVKMITKGFKNDDIIGKGKVEYVIDSKLLVKSTKKRSLSASIKLK